MEGPIASPPPAPLISAEVHRAVDQAAQEAFAKHGELTADPVRALAILGREWGEAMDEALHKTIPRPPFNTLTNQVFFANRLAEELLQVAATAMMMVENLMTGKGGEGEP